MSRFTLPALLTAAALAVGCAGTVYSDGYGYDYYDGYGYTPDLVSIGAGVSVVAGYHDPVFYSDNYYWRPDYYGRWYRSSYYDRGWAYATPPYAVASIHSPYSYRYYRPHGYTIQKSPYYYGHGYGGRGYYGGHGYHGNVRSYDRSYHGSPTYRGNVRSYDRTYQGSPVNRGNQHYYSGRSGHSRRH